MASLNYVYNTKTTKLSIEVIYFPSKDFSRFSKWSEDKLRTLTNMEKKTAI